MFNDGAGIDKAGVTNSNSKNCWAAAMERPLSPVPTYKRISSEKMTFVVSPIGASLQKVTPKQMAAVISNHNVRLRQFPVSRPLSPDLTRKEPFGRNNSCGRHASLVRVLKTSPDIIPYRPVLYTDHHDKVRFEQKISVVPKKDIRVERFRSPSVKKIKKESRQLSVCSPRRLAPIKRNGVQALTQSRGEFNEPDDCHNDCQSSLTYTMNTMSNENSETECLATQNKRRDNEDTTSDFFSSVDFASYDEATVLSSAGSNLLSKIAFKKKYHKKDLQENTKQKQEKKGTHIFLNEAIDASDDIMTANSSAVLGLSLQKKETAISDDHFWSHALNAIGVTDDDNTWTTAEESLKSKKNASNFLNTIEDATTNFCQNISRNLVSHKKICAYAEEHIESFKISRGCSDLQTLANSRNCWERKRSSFTRMLRRGTASQESTKGLEDKDNHTETRSEYGLAQFKSEDNNVSSLTFEEYTAAYSQENLLEAAMQRRPLHKSHIEWMQGTKALEVHDTLDYLQDMWSCLDKNLVGPKKSS
uniref:Uncharacterized protein n=1 Tax=Corethron hystrix TaxID=216773 RepID=A0A7S1B7V0_9STRA|mmetsp:Transcript_16484/g.37042  ORF Transcript_16484/g.37042 Transcript_16484/m.37042 type:complete len:532 (+) Transcript_16484:227-1822(+)